MPGLPNIGYQTQAEFLSNQVLYLKTSPHSYVSKKSWITLKAAARHHARNQPRR